ncbi:MAG TPA: MerR family transcriptional regulator [Roseiarcus sp.]|nr:MerR family transcriptional regulator [Roseiarcus sp.]
MDKSPDAFRTISEVAQSLDLPQHVLRFWESRFPQIKPLKRGGGRRYYRPDDVELLRAIKHLLYNEGYTIKGVQRLFKEQGARALAAKSSADDEAVIVAASAEGEFAEPAQGVAPVGEAGRLSVDEFELLHAALAELAECERILSTARAR